MSEPYLGQLLLVPYNFPPKGWAFCQGQLLSISQNTALFSLLGTYYGGDGKSTFGLPNLQGKIAVGMGQGPGLSPYTIGQSGGAATVTVTDSQNPSHTHTPISVGGRGASTSQNPLNQNLADGTADYAPLPANAKLSPLSMAGGGQPHNNMMPYLTLNWIIALAGVFPPRG